MADPMHNPTPGTSRRVMVYCHDSVGVGHLRRTLALTRNLHRAFPDASFLMATGTPFVPMFGMPAAIDYIKLPALCKKADGSYSSKYLDFNTERLLQCRQSLLFEAAVGFQPDVVLVDKAPVGVCCELLPTLEHLHRNLPHVRLILGLRDIEDERGVTMEQWARNGSIDAMTRLYDEIWVYGMAEVFDLTAQYALPAAVREKLSYQGYLGRPPCGKAHHPATTQPNVLVTVGGGTDGERLLSAYLTQAAPRAASLGISSTLVAGPDLPHEARQRLRAQAATLRRVEWIEVERCMSCRLQACGLVVCMGGYNTMCEVASHRKPALVIPRSKPRLEQTIRATLWEQRGAVRVLHGEDVTPQTLAEHVVEMLLHWPRRTSPDLDLNGLRRVRQRFASFWNGESHHAAAVCV